MRRAIEANRNFPLAHFYLSALLSLLGRLDGARAAVRAGLRLKPNFTIRRFRVNAPSSDPIYLSKREQPIHSAIPVRFKFLPIRLLQQYLPTAEVSLTGGAMHCRSTCVCAIVELAT
jgi:hypothetical protein